jgi:hypothetical protein
MNRQLHKRFNNEQVKDIVSKFDKKLIRAKEACRFLGIGRTRFHSLVKMYRKDSQQKLVGYTRSTPTRTIKDSVKTHILSELAIEKEKIIDNPDVPTNHYNYSYIRNLLVNKYAEKAALSTIISLAKDNDYYKPKRKKRDNEHTRVVLTNFVGELIQHDASPHLFAPDSKEKWSLITSIDDYSRKLLSARLVRRETVWQHILSVEEVCTIFGIPFSYYIDQHSIFRYVKDRDKFSVWTTYTKFTGDVDTQWAALLKELSVKPIYALSPQAKGKIERPYQWLQDHLVRTCVRYGITNRENAQNILDEEVYLYNTKRIHSTTGEIPDIRFNKALKEEKTLFRPFSIPTSYISTKDIFALRQQRRTDGYRSISLFGKQMKVPKADPYQDIDIRYSPREKDEILFRFWTNNNFLGEQLIPKTEFPDVHF